MAKKTGTKKTAEKKASGRTQARKPTAGSTTKKTSKAPAKRPTSGEPKRKSGLLDSAADVLRRVKKPMSSAEIVEKVLASGVWSTKGKTPAATLNAAIHREIEKKGKESRFKKVDRGRFALAGE